MSVLRLYNYISALFYHLLTEMTIVFYKNLLKRHCKLWKKQRDRDKTGI